VQPAREHRSFGVAQVENAAVMTRTTQPAAPHTADEWLALSLRLRDGSEAAMVSTPAARSDIVLRVRIPKPLWRRRSASREDVPRPRRLQRLRRRMYSWVCQ
jgi:hypothetical protein